jgi:2-deoxy-D-gluconate 3-dehydrogenase
MDLGAETLFRLDGRTALITGANSGIGEAVARLLAEAGADIAVAIQPGTDASRVIDHLQGLGRRAQVFEADLNDVPEIERMVQAATGWLGRLDILGNIAGVGLGGPILEMTARDWDLTLNINTRAVYFMAQAAARVMIPQGGGKIVNIASVNAFRGFPYGSLYNLSKAAVVSMTQTMAAEWAPDHILVNAIAPGWTETQMLAGMSPARAQWVLDHVPLGRRAQPSEIAAMVLFLASPASEYATGQTFAVDGGFLASALWGL